MPPGRPWDYDEDAPGEEDAEAPPGIGPTVLGGADATIGARDPDSMWMQAKEAVSEALFGHPDRAEAKAAGIGQTPTGAEMLMGAAAPAALAASSAIPAVGAVAPMVGKAVGAYSGGRAGYRAGGIPGAVAGAVIGAAKPGPAGGVEGAIEGYHAGGVPGAVLGAVLGSKAGNAGKVVPIAAGKEATKTVAPAVMAEAQAIEAKIADWSLRQGLSGAQIAAALKQIHGIPMKDATKMVQMVLASIGR